MKHIFLMNPAAGKAANAKVYHLDALDDTAYLKSIHTDVEVHNLFDYANANYYYDDAPVTYLSRADWQGTWSSGETLAMNDRLREALKTGTYEKAADTPAPVKGEDYAVEGDLTLADMIGADYDDPRWEPFIRQLTLAELYPLRQHVVLLVDVIGQLADVVAAAGSIASHRHHHRLLGLEVLDGMPYLL